MNDFEYAFKNDIKPAFGVKDNKLQQFIVNGIIEWSSKIKKILADGSDLTITAAQGIDNVMTDDVMMTSFFRKKNSNGYSAHRRICWCW